MSFARALGALILGGVLAMMVLMTACGETRDVTDDLGVDDIGVGKLKGDTCGASTECAGGNCVDGVCCESTCAGVCEACNLAGQLGTCAAVATGTDPAMECMPKLVDAPDGGSADGGTVVNVPDGGINSMEGPCAPKCDGKRACGFPDQTVVCGDHFCNDAENVANSVCDGLGHCGIAVTACDAYVCGPSACKTSCVANTDCLDTHFCNVSGQCQAKKSLGVSCGGNPSECASGFCADGVCCNSDCGSISGGKCNNVGAVGTCKCTVTVPTTGICDGTCEYYYLDADNDGYGKVTDRVVGCTGDPDNNPAKPPGRVTNGSDCGDDDSRVRPGAGMSTASIWTSTWSPQFDWNCDGAVTKKFPYRPGATCKYCSPRSESAFLGGPQCGGTAITSSVANQWSSIYCTQSECTGSKGGIALCLSRCCGQGCSDVGAFGINMWAFVSGGSACGTTGTMRWCQMGAGAGSAVPAPVDFSDTQECQ